MTVKAFILIETAVGRTKEVSTALNAVPGVKSVDPVTGPYDIIATIEGTDINVIGNLVTKNIHPIEGVIRTVSCIAMELS